MSPSDTALPARLAETSYWSFWSARVLTSASFQIAAVVVGWQLYSLTSSAFDLGLVGLCQFLPMLVLTLPAGHIADRFDRRTVVRLCQWVEGATMACLCIASATGAISPPLIFTAAAILGACRTIELPAMAALLPGVVGTPLLPRAVALSASAMETATILGPALGGVLYLAGPKIAYGIVAVLYAAASLCIWSIKLAAPHVARREPVSLDNLLSGFRFIRAKPIILGAISLDMVAVLLGGATALLPIYARDILHTSSLGLGALRAAPAVGALLTSLLLARRPLSKRVGVTMFTAVAVFGAGTVLFGLSTSFPLSLVALTLMGAADVVSVVIRSTLVQLETPDAMRGRVSAVNFLFVGTSNQLGEFESGTTAALFGTVPAVVIGGIGTILVAVLWSRLFPALRKVDSMRDL
ncbi:MFS transporter [Segnochrobactrum spirostomi]|uniref:MFS transporter n=1 Tax=Segnochrobactrum spirostomi TaxID=2608987 RepID=A0A6A7XZ86_9HYPH|nr:MFS transporter [Segnochrobactrum spirostomi]